MNKIIQPSQEELDKMFLLSNKRHRSKKLKTCLYCGVKFKHGQGHIHSCSLCKIKYNCPFCGKEHIKTLNRAEMKDSLPIIRKSLENNELEKWKKFCNQSCAKLYNTLPGNCIKCGEYSNKRTITGSCFKCSSRSVAGNCTKCGEYSLKRSAAGLCKKCCILILNKRMGKGLCTVCKKMKDKRDAYGQCKDCSIKRAKKFTGKGVCLKCNLLVDSRNAAGLCNKCSSNSGQGECTNCKRYSKVRNRYGLCPECFKKNTPGKCLICGKIVNKRDVCGLCKDCADKCGGFDRESYYSKILSPIKFQYINKSISKASLKGIEKFNKIPGVWAIWSGNECLDVCQTIDIGKEMLTVSRCLDFNKDLTDEEIEEENKRYYYNRRKKRDQAQYDDITYKIVAINIEDKEKREEIEAYYAHENKSIFWSPAPNQKI